MIKVGVVVPTNRPEKFDEWMHAWMPLLEDRSAYEVTLYPIHDNADTWKEIQADLKENSWIIPVRTDCIRSYGFLKAWRDGNDITMTFDDDTRPEDTDVIFNHIEELQKMVEPDGWVRTLKYENAPPTRGLPLVRKVGLNHGLWLGVPDVSAQTQLTGEYDDPYEDPVNEQIIPEGYYYPMCGMNIAFNTRLTRFMYQTLQGWDIRDPYGTEWGLHRCGDILSGILSKTVFDRLTVAVHSGRPYVHHDRASDPNVNLPLEANTLAVPGILANIVRGSAGYMEAAGRLYNLHIAGVRKDYFRHLAGAMRIWYDLTKGEPGEFTRARGVASSGFVSKSEDEASSDPGLAEG